MGGRDVIELETVLADDEGRAAANGLLMEASSDEKPQPLNRQITQAGIVVGELIGMTDEGRVPLVRYPSQAGTAALPSRTVVDLHGPHIGRKVVLTFEDGDSTRPIIMGLLREGDEGWPLNQKPGQIEVNSDGERLIVTAKNQLVIQCGKARITLTKAGKVLIEGTYVLNRSSGANRLKGGSVEIN